MRNSASERTAPWYGVRERGHAARSATQRVLACGLEEIHGMDERIRIAEAAGFSANEHVVCYTANEISPRNSWQQLAFQANGARAEERACQRRCFAAGEDKCARSVHNELDK